MNVVFLEQEMRLAVAMKGYDKELVKADEVAAKVRWVMDSEGGRVLRERTLAAMRQAKDALREGGESEATLAGGGCLGSCLRCTEMCTRTCKS
jgi:hypothetical protein